MQPQKTSVKLTKEPLNKIFTIGSSYMLVPGKGVLSIPDNQINFVAAVVLTEEGYAKMPFFDNSQFLYGIQFNRQGENLIDLWQSEFENKTKQNISIVRVKVSLKEQNHSNAIKLINHLQKKGLWVICSLIFEQGDLSNQHKYQEVIFRFNKQITQTQAIYATGLSFQLEILENIPDSEVSTLCIWRRVISNCIGSIIVRKWSNKAIYKMHFVKNTMLAYSLSFITCNMNECQSLGLECIGAE